MSQPVPPPENDPDLLDDRRDDPPEPASSWVRDHMPPATEAERQAQETIRSVSRLEESN